MIILTASILIILCITASVTMLGCGLIYGHKTRAVLETMVDDLTAAVNER